MKKVIGANIRWHRLTDSRYRPYGPWYAINDDARTIGVVSETPRLDGRWLSWVFSPKDQGKRLYGYAGSLERAKYFVECWAKYHQRKFP